MESGLSRDWGSCRDGCWRMRIVGGLEAPAGHIAPSPHPKSLNTPPAVSSSWVPSLRASVTACLVAGLMIIGQARGVRGIRRAHGSICARPRDPEPRNAKPAEAAGPHGPKPGKLILWQE